MVLKASQERVTTLLKDTITLLCKNGLEFKNKFSVEALIGVTLDDNDVFLISMNELVQSDNPVATENDDNESNPDSTDTRKSPKSPRHRRHKRRHSGESRQSDTEATSSLPVARVKTEPGLTSQDNEAPPGPGGNQNPKPENVWNQNEFQPLSLTPVDDSSLHSLTNMTTNEEPRTKMLKFENSRTGDDDEEEVEGDEEDEDDDDLVFIKQEATDTPGSSCSQQSFTGNPLGSPSFQNQNYSFSDASMLSQDSTMAGSMMSPQQYKQYPRGRPRVSTATNLQPQSQQQQNMGDGSQQQGMSTTLVQAKKASVQANKRLKYPPENMAKAVEAVRNGMPKRQAAKEFKVPRSTLLDKLYGRHVANKCGASPVLTKAEEETLVQHIGLMWQIGYPMSRMDLAAEVKKILDLEIRPNPFRNNTPGKDWFKAFAQRNPGVVERLPRNLKRERACVTLAQITDWYSNCQQYLVDEVPGWEHILTDPRRVYSCSATGFPLSVATGQVSFAKGECHAVPSSKEQLTVMEGMNAVGNYIPPLIIFPGQRIHDVSLQGYPEARYGLSENGCMDSNLFLEYLKHFVDSVKSQDIIFPVILFVDAHSAHMSRTATLFCSENGVILYCLLSNATHIMRPCDGLFSQLESAWKEEVEVWQMQHPGEAFSKNDFPGVYKQARETVCATGNAISAFTNTGLFPFTIDGIDKTKLTQRETQLSHPINHVSLIIPIETPIDQTVTTSQPQQVITDQSLNLSVSTVSSLPKANIKSKRQQAKSKSANTKAMTHKTRDEDSDATDGDIPYMDDDESDGEINPDICGGCGMPEGDSGPEWVGCDSCPRFWHILCTGDEILQSLVTLEEIEDYNFHCKFC